MRALWISSSFPPGIGGLQAYCDAVSRHLAELLDLSIVTAQGQRPSARAAHLECAGLAGGDERDFERAGANLRGIVDSAQPDVVHFGDAQAAALAPFLPAAVPLVATVHGNDFTSPWVRYGRRDMPAAIRAGLARCQVVCVSEHTAALVRSSAMPAALTVVHNACDLERFRNIDFDRAGFLARLGVPADVPLLLTVGRLAARKSHATIVRALARLDRPFHWLVVGGGDRWRLDLARFLHGLRGRMSLVGWLAEDDLVRCYNTADIFVLTPVERRVRGSLDSEGFGLVYHEAAACGVPSIASDASGCREAVLHGRTGLLVPPGDPARLRDALQTLLADPALRHRLGAAARAHVRSQGGWQLVARKLIDIYRAACGARSRQGTAVAYG